VASFDRAGREFGNPAPGGASKSQEGVLQNGMRFRLLALAVIGGILLSGSALAQFGKKKDQDSNVRTVQGIVTDEAENPISGAVVQLENMKTLQIRSYITKEKGDYYFSDLSTDIDYKLRAENHGMVSSTKTLSSFDNRKQATMNLKVDQQKK
jgi:hypothetical protein